MPTPIATDIEGTHPLFTGSDEPVDVDATDSRWKITTSGTGTSKRAVLDATLATGKVLTLRIPTTGNMAKEGNVASYPLGSYAVAKWSTYREHVKLWVEFSAAPPSTTLSTEIDRLGVTLASDGDGGLNVLDGAVKIGALPKPWIEYKPDAAANRTRVYLAWVLSDTTVSVTMPALSGTEWATAVLDPTVITTSTASTATAYSNQRKIDRTQNNVLWVLFWDGTSTTTTSMRTRYSTDNGATWVDPGTGSAFGFASTNPNFTPDASLFIDLDDYAHVAYLDRNNGNIVYRRGTPNAARTAWTWSAATGVSNSGSGEALADIVAFRTPGASPTTWDVVIVASTVTSSNDSALYERLRIANDGSVTTENLDGLASSHGMGRLSAIHSNSTHKFPSIDFNHTGDGKTVAGGTPHLYVGWSAGAAGAGKGIRFRKATFSAGAWTWGAEREIDSTQRVDNGDWRWLDCLFDGTRVILPGYTTNAGNTSDVILCERDAADTATTIRVLVSSAVAGTAMISGSATYDASGNVYYLGNDFSGSGSGSRALVRRRWNRATATFEAASTFDTTGPEAPFISAKRGYSNSRIEFVYTDGTASPFNVTYDGLSLATLVAVSPALETDTALAIGRRRAFAVTPATETDLAVILGRRKRKLVGVSLETDQALFISKGRLFALLPATEADASVAVGTVFTPVYYRFTPPTREESVRGDRLFSRFSIPVGQSVVKVNGLYTVTPYPWLGDLAALIDGNGYFLGGHDYTVDNKVALDLRNQGFTVTPVRGYKDIILADNPVGYWRLGESSGTTAVDSSGNGRNGTYQGSPTLGVAGGIVGDTDKAMELHGVGTDFISVPSAGVADTGNAITVEGWVNLDSVPAIDNNSPCLIAEQFPSGSSVRFAVGLDFTATGKMFAGFYDGTWRRAIAPTAVTIGSWEHWAGTYDGTTIRLYRNGAEVASSVQSVALPATGGGEWRIGKRWDSDQTLDGRLDEAAIYDRALTAAEISEHYRAGTSGL